MCTVSWNALLQALGSNHSAQKKSSRECFVAEPKCESHSSCAAQNCWACLQEQCARKWCTHAVPRKIWSIHSVTNEKQHSQGSCMPSCHKESSSMDLLPSKNSYQTNSPLCLRVSWHLSHLKHYMLSGPCRGVTYSQIIFLFSSASHCRYDEAKTKLKASGLGDGTKLSFALLGFAWPCCCLPPESIRVYQSESTMSFATWSLDASILLWFVMHRLQGKESNHDMAHQCTKMAKYPITFDHNGYSLKPAEPSS